MAASFKAASELITAPPVPRPGIDMAWEWLAIGVVVFIVLMVACLHELDRRRKLKEDEERDQDPPHYARGALVAARAPERTSQRSSDDSSPVREGQIPRHKRAALLAIPPGSGCAFKHVLSILFWITTFLFAQLLLKTRQ
jgi:hypothetical protein